MSAALDPAAEGVRVDRTDQVLRLTIDRPDRLNAVTPSLIEVLHQQIDGTTARVVVLSGQGRAFSSGADLDPEAAEPAGGATLVAANRLLRTMTTGDAVVIARINGPAAGIGCSLALAADLPVMSDDAYLLLPFTGIGLMPDGGVTATWAASAGRVHALRAALFGERVTAADALRAGLVAATAPGPELDALVDGWVDTLVRLPRLALARTKQAINAATLGHLPEVLAREEREQESLLDSADFAEGVQAFLARRVPRFTD